jgi:diguanylate cyclase (GGDEF)-like protein
MQEDIAPSRPPLTLIASGHEWLARSFESVLGPNGYAVLRAYTGHQAIEHARNAQPDAIVLDVSLTDIEGIEVCRTLRADPQIAPGTPIFLTTAGPASRQARLEALRSGAWEFFGLPLDAEELLLKLGSYVTAKIEADRAREESLLDQLTGFYNVRGLLRRVRELGSDAFRYRRALACIVLSPETEPETAGAEATGEKKGAPPPVGRLAKILKETCRASDAIGRLGQNEFVVIAPNTDPRGALNLAQRLSTAAESIGASAEPGQAAPVKLRAGLFAVPDFKEASIQPVDMLVRATMALRRSQAEPTADRIRAFDIQGPVSLS